MPLENGAADTDDGPDLRESIEAAIDGADGGEGSAQTTPDPGAAAAPASDSGEPPAGQVRDALGRFVPKAAAQEPAGAPQPAQAPNGTAQPQIGAPAAPQAPAQAFPAPQSWSPALREAHWAKLDPQVQEQIARREYEFTQAFRQVAPARQLGEQFWNAVQPFMPTIQAEGVDPLTAVTNLMQVSTRLRMGTPLEKASTVAQIVQAYGIDIQALDSALAGVAPPPGQTGADPQYVQQAVQQALQPLYQAAQQHQAAQQQAVGQRAAGEMQAFAADPKNRFFNDLREAMADVIELAERQGRDVSLAEAYQTAAMLHPEISKLMIAERQGVNANQLTEAARRAKAAAVSVNGAAPVGNPGGPEPSSIRESIEAAIAAHSRV